MAIRAKNLKIPNIFSPVLQPARPRPRPVFWADLGRCVNVIEFKNTNVRISTTPALTSKTRYDGNTSGPVSFLFSAGVQCGLAHLGAVSAFARGTAVHTYPPIAPSFRRIATVRAIFGILFASPALLDIKNLITHDAVSVLTGRLPVRRKPLQAFIPSGRTLFPRALLGAEFTGTTPNKSGAASFAVVMYWFHAKILALRQGLRNYFEIAVERVRKAYAQPDLFVAGPKPETLVQQEIFGGSE